MPMGLRGSEEHSGGTHLGEDEVWGQQMSTEAGFHLGWHCNNVWG